MNENIKITIDTLLNKALRISKSDKYTSDITDLIDIAYDFDYDYAEALRIELDIYRP